MSSNLRESSFRAKKIILWALLNIVFLAVLAAFFLEHRSGSHLSPSLGPAPDFQLVDQRSKAVQKSDFYGKIWVAGFVFTHCAGQCPFIVEKVIELKNKFGQNPDLKYVFFSVDPERDTVEVLSSYAARYDLDDDNVYFLTGSKKDVQAVVEKGFRLALAPGTDPKEPIIHSNRLVLVGRKGKMLGAFLTVDNESFQSLQEVIQGELKT